MLNFYLKRLRLQSLGGGVGRGDRRGIDHRTERLRY